MRHWLRRDMSHFDYYDMIVRDCLVEGEKHKQKIPKYLY